MVFHKVPHLQRTANKHRIFKSDSCLAESEETRSQYHWCQCCCWCLLAWMTRLEIGVNNSSSFTLFPLSACFSQHDFSMSPGEMGFLTIPLPEPMTILMIDHSPLDCGERKGSRPQCKIKKKKRGEGGKRGVDNSTRSEWCPVFCFQWWDQWPAQPRGDRESNWRRGRNRCSYTMNMLLVGCIFAKSQGADFPFHKTKKNTARDSRLSTCGPISGKNVAEAIRRICSSLWFTPC